MCFPFYRWGTWDPERCYWFNESHTSAKKKSPSRRFNSQACLSLCFSLSISRPRSLHLPLSYSLPLCLSLTISFSSQEHYTQTTLECSKLMWGDFFLSLICICHKQRTSLISMHCERAVVLVLVLQLHIPKSILTTEMCSHNIFLLSWFT